MRLERHCDEVLDVLEVPETLSRGSGESLRLKVWAFRTGGQIAARHLASDVQQSQSKTRMLRVRLKEPIRLASLFLDGFWEAPECLSESGSRVGLHNFSGSSVRVLPFRCSFRACLASLES